MIGLARGTVKVESYNPKWKEIYEYEESHLYECIGEYALDIQHIGSTSIEELDAKPIIDIAVGISDFSLIEYLKETLKELGYCDRGNALVQGRQLFVKGTEELRTHYIHVVLYNGSIWNNHIKFRDYLRSNKQAIKEYSKLKLELASRYGNNRDLYTKAKNRFIKNILNICNY